MKTTMLWLWTMFLSAGWLFAVSPASGSDFMFRARVDGRMVEGKPLAWTSSQMLLLGRDGQLYEFDPRAAKEATRTSPRFFGYSTSEMRAELQREFDQRFDITTTQHYMVVHPRGQRDQWAERFEDLYRRFNHYFRVRGFSLAKPQYPLVAVVFRDEAEYFAHAGANGVTKQPGTLGHYEPLSNRVYLFDITSNTGGDWSRNAETIIHEATHQTAFNVGIHQRFTLMPRWLGEGLATMFEARGVWNRQYDHTLADRINREQLHIFRNYVATRREPDSLVRLIASDERFRSDAGAAYAEAWALSFYLCETQPRLYAAYLAKTAERPLFSKYDPDERLADFQQVFGREMKMFDVKFLRYIEELR